MTTIPNFTTLQAATTYLQERFNRNDFTCTEIPYQEDGEVIFCVCTDDMEYQTASIEIDQDGISFIFDNMQGDQILCNDLDEVFTRSKNFKF